MSLRVHKDGGEQEGAVVWEELSVATETRLQRPAAEKHRYILLAEAGSAVE